MKVLVFGAGIIGSRYYESVKSSQDLSVLAFVDNNEKLIRGHIGPVPIVPPSAIDNYAYDKIIVAVSPDEKSFGEILEQLKGYGIPEEKLEPLEAYDYFPYNEESDARVRWLKNFAAYANNINIAGNVAECGVFRGQFARFINKYFSSRKLYLFDTFAGFDKGDVNAEISYGNASFNNGRFARSADIFGDTSIDTVMRRIPYPDNCVIRQGYFPDTAHGVEDSFCFVNLDMDLYQPMLGALHFFWGKMSVGGVILLHDYFHPELPGVAQAVEAFEKEIHTNIIKTTIGDFCSIALIKA